MRDVTNRRSIFEPIGMRLELECRTGEISKTYYVLSESDENKFNFGCFYDLYSPAVMFRKKE